MLIRPDAGDDAAALRLAVMDCYQHYETDLPPDAVEALIAQLDGGAAEALLATKFYDALGEFRSGKVHFNVLAERFDDLT